MVPAGTSKGTNTKLPWRAASKLPETAWSGPGSPQLAGGAALAAEGADEAEYRDRDRQSRPPSHRAPVYGGRPPYLTVTFPAMKAW